MVLYTIINYVYSPPTMTKVSESSDIRKLIIVIDEAGLLMAKDCL